MNKFYVLFFLSLFLCSHLEGQNQNFTPEQIKADLLQKINLRIDYIYWLNNSIIKIISNSS